jgi:hypothetical protein
MQRLVPARELPVTELGLPGLPANFWLIVSILYGLDVWLRGFFFSSLTNERHSSYSWLHPRAPLLIAKLLIPAMQGR